MALGVVAKPHGIHGGLKVALYNPKSTLLAEQAELWFVQHAHQAKCLRVVHAQQQKGIVLLNVEGCTSRTNAEAFRGMEVCVPVESLPKLDEGEYYHRDLLGLSVWTDADQLVGEIVEVLDYPSVSCLQVKSADGLREIPLLEDYISDVDLARRRVTVRGWDQFDVEKA